MTARNMQSSFYRTEDSVDNFVLKLSVREISKVLHKESDPTAKPFQEELTLHWQEKKYGPADISNFLKNKEAQNKPKDVYEADTFRHMTMLEERGKPLVNLLNPVMLYTYTDKNNRLARTKGPVRYLTDDNMETYLSVGASHRRNDDIGSREKKINERFYREKPFKVMHICMATDVNVEALKSKPMYPEAHFAEHVLCSIFVYDDGLIEFSPDLSQNLDESKRRNADIMSPSVFMNDETVAASLTKDKGIKLNTYLVTSASGRTFEFALQNLNGLFSPTELDAKRRADAIKDTIHARNNRVFDNTAQEVDKSQWQQDPPSKGSARSICYYADIISGQGCEGERLFVDYEVLVPQTWSLRTGNLVDGTNEQDLLSQSKKGGDAVGAVTADLTKQALLTDGYADGEDARGMLRGVTQMASVSEQRGGLILTDLRPFWRGNRMRHSFDPITRGVFGFAYFFYNVLCIILGINSPFWLISAVAFVYAIGSGHPGGSTQAVVQKTNVGDSRGSGQHKSAANRQLAGDLVSRPIANFNHLINLSFDVKDGDVATSSPSANVPTVVFTVYSVGAFGRINIEGYAYVHLPEHAGAIDDTIKTWRPTGGIDTQMRAYFLGSAPHVVNKAEFYASDKFGTHTVLNHFGVRTENSGEIRFRVHAVSVDPRKVKVNTVKLDSEKEKKLAGARRTVDQILKTYRSGTSLTKSIDLVQSTGGLSSSMFKSSTSIDGSTELSKRAEMLIAQAKTRISASGSKALIGLNKSSSSPGSESKDSLREEYQRQPNTKDRSSDVEAAKPLLSTKPSVRMEPLQLERLTGARRQESRRYAGAGEGESEGDSLLGHGN